MKKGFIISFGKVDKAGLFKPFRMPVDNNIRDVGGSANKPIQNIFSNSGLKKFLNKKRKIEKTTHKKIDNKKTSL